MASCQQAPGRSLLFCRISNLAESSRPLPLLDFPLTGETVSCLWLKIHFLSLWVPPYGHPLEEDLQPPAGMFLMFVNHPLNEGFFSSYC